MSEEMKNASNNNENNAVVFNDADDNDMEVLIEQDEDDIDDLEIETTSGLDSLDKAFNRSLGSSNSNAEQVKGNANSNQSNTSSSNVSNVQVSNSTKTSNNDVEDEEKNGGWSAVTYKATNKVADEIDEIEKTDEFDEVDDDGVEGKNPNGNINSNAGNNQNNVGNKGQSGGWFSSFKQNGKYNTRPIIIAALAVGFIVAILFSSSTGNKDKDKNSKVVAPPEPSRMVENRVDNDELEPVTTRYFPEPERTEDPRPLPTVTIPPAILPAPGEPVKSGSPVQPGKPVEVEESKEFGIELRAGTEAALKKINNDESNNDADKTNILDGLTIPMILLEPFRSGISTLVKAQVINDVINSKGEVVVKANTRVQVPFERFEIDGRVMNDSDKATIFLLPGGKRLTATGIVKGIDGFAGIKGKVKKLSKGNVFARMGKTFTRVGARVIGVQTGGLSGRGIEDTINESVDQNLEAVPTGRIVEVLPGTRFTFTATER